MTEYVFKTLHAWQLQGLCKFGCILTGKGEDGYHFACNPTEDVKSYE